MRELRDVAEEAGRLELDVTHVVEKSRDGVSLFLQLESLRRVQEGGKEGGGKGNEDPQCEKKTLQECKDDFVRVSGNASEWDDLVGAMHPANVTSHTSTAASIAYFDELDKHWDSIRRTPTLDVTDRYSAPVVLSNILRPFLSMGSHFVFSMSRQPMLPFDLGESHPPLPPLTVTQQQKRLELLMKRLKNLYKSSKLPIEYEVNMSMLQSFVSQMKENEAVIDSFENVAFSSPVKPTNPTESSEMTNSFGRGRPGGQTSSTASLFVVKQTRTLIKRNAQQIEWEETIAKLLEWHSADDESVQLTIFALPSRTKTRKCKEIGRKEHDYWFGVLMDNYTIDSISKNIREKLLSKLKSWPKKKPVNRRNVLPDFWDKCIESIAVWENLLETTADDTWQPRYPAMPKHVYSARLLSDKMLVYANSLRDEIEDLITPLLVFGQTKDINNTSYFCNPNSPSSDWVDYPGGIRQQSIFSFVSKSMSGLGQDCAVANKYRRQKMVPLSASLYEKNPSSSNTDPPLADTSTSLRYEEGTDMDAVDGKSIRGRRRWSVGLGEKEIIDNVGGTPVAGIPPVLPEESIPVHSAIQWAFNQSSNKFFFLKTDLIKLSCDLKNLKAVLTCERNGKENSVTLPLKECFRVDSVNKDLTLLEINLLDSESYHVVEELKKSKLQLHTALKYNRPESDILTILSLNPDCVAEKDFDGKLPLMIAIEKGESSNIIGSLLALSLPMDLEGNFKEFPGGSFCWIYVLTQTSDKYVEAVVHVLNTFVKDMTLIIKISALTDEFGRKALDVATPKCRRAILSTMYFLGRYELKDGPPEHKSATCLVHIAIDRDNADMPVALKLMKWRSQYNRELQSRNDCAFDGEYVLGIIRSYDGDDNKSFCDELQRKGYGSYRYCIVMPAAERNLAGVMAHEHIAGKDWKKIKQVAEELCECVVHVHGKGMIHGDIKPLNIVRESGRIKLLDLDACVSYQNKDVCGAKFSSAYLPPEMIYCDVIALTAVVKSYQINEDSGEIIHDQSSDFQLMVADTSMDAWALGITAFELCTGEPFFLNNDEDNIDEQNLFALGSFSPKLKQEKMKKIANPQARNFVSLLMNADARKRLSVPRALQHPFITGKDAARLPGDEAEFDVFISYRVASDAHHAAMLYEMLSGKGLKVWWDKMCLEAGVPWDEGFCHGLIKSHACIPLLSRHAINHPEISYQNFEKLKEGSRCDNVFLEYRLALELREMGLVEKIFPVMIGDVSDEQNPTDDDADATGPVYSHYFGSGCHPKLASTDSVSAVESALRVHLDNEGLGSPYSTSESPQSVLSQITQNQGAFLVGSLTECLPNIVNTIVEMVHHSDDSDKQHLIAEESISALTKVTSSGVGGAVAALKSRVESLAEENEVLKQRQEDLKHREKSSQAAIASLRSENEILKKLHTEAMGDATSVQKFTMPTAFAEELAKFDQGLEISPR